MTVVPGVREYRFPTGRIRVGVGTSRVSEVTEGPAGAYATGEVGHVRMCPHVGPPMSVPLGKRVSSRNPTPRTP